MARRPFVGGNWKLNGDKAFVDSFIGLLNNAELNPAVEVVIAPTSLYSQYANSIVKNGIQIAVQNASNESKGAFTGEISAESIKDSGIPYVILGHSERRAIFGESDALIGKKVKHALEVGVKVIFCFGEKLEEREAGETMQVVIKQLEAVVPGINNWDNVVLAYEPVWAIGTGKTATPDQAQEVHLQIRQWLAANVSQAVADTTRIIYGGSVKKDNSKDLASRPDIDGFLVGGASLLPEFVDIINATA